MESDAEASHSHTQSRLVRATPFYYGWVILAAATVGLIMMGPSQAFTTSVFLDFYIRDLAISRTTVSLLYGIGTLAASFLLPLTGRLVDRRGPRRMVVAIASLLGLACFAMGAVTGPFTLLLTFMALRFLGFGSLQLVSGNVIAQWFIRQRGRVMGYAGFSLALGLLIFPDLCESLISAYGWRWAWVGLGLLVWATVIPVGWLFWRDQPEAFGLLPDGDEQPTAESPAPIAEVNWTAAEARHTLAFWIFTLSMATLTATTSSLVFHQLSLFEARGLSREVAVAAFRYGAPFSVAGNLIVGRLIDSVRTRTLTSAVLALMAASILLIQTMTTPFHGFLFGAMLGFVGGAYRVIDATVWPKYFGRRHLGAIRGLTMVGIIAGTALGPYPLGLSHDLLGSYLPALNLLLIFPVILGITILFISPPEKNY